MTNNNSLSFVFSENSDQPGQHGSVLITWRLSVNEKYSIIKRLKILSQKKR